MGKPGGWNFLSNHLVLLSFIARYPRITALELAQAIGITERAVRNLIADLVQAGYIWRQREGRRNLYGVNPSLDLRHPSYPHVAVGDLLRALGWRRRQRKPRQGDEASASPGDTSS